MTKCSRTVVAIVALVIVAGIGAYTYKEHREDANDWTSYDLQETGISFQYPSDWTITQLSDPKAGVMLQPTSDTTEKIYIDTIPNPENLSIEKLFDTFSDLSRFWFEKYSYETVRYNKLSGVKFPSFEEASGSFRTEIILTCQGKVAALSYQSTKNQKHADILQNIAQSVSCN